MPRASQFLLPLEGGRSDQFEGFVPGPNLAVVEALQNLLSAQEGVVYIRGPEGSGKTHLLNASCDLARRRNLKAFYMRLGDLPVEAADGLGGLESMDLVCIDDIHRIAGVAPWEHAVFHLFNRMRTSQGRMIISSSQPLSSLRFGLPDLASRLAWGIRLQLDPLDDEAKLEILQLKAQAQGIDLPPDVGRYLLQRGSRNTGDLLASLEAVRVAALKGKRRITVPLARDVLADHTN